MAPRPGIVDAEVTLNSPLLGKWPESIGKFILNFANIEVENYIQLLLLEPTRSSYNRNLDMLLSKRITRLDHLLVHTKLLTPQERTGVRKAWRDVRELAKFRNLIAHNPVLPSWKPGSDSEKSPPDVLGVADFRMYKNGPKTVALPLAALQALIDESCKVAMELHECTRKLRGEA